MKQGPGSELELPALVGQLILGRVSGSSLDEETAGLLKKGHISGVTLFADNLESLEQLIALCRQIREASFHPPIIAVDQEGGAVQRFASVLSPIPSMMALGRLADSERLKMVIALSAKQMRLLGVNCVFAPVADVNTNCRNPIIGTRAFSENAETVADLSGVVLRSYLEAGVLPVIKHFPGHGDSSLDSHLELPRLSHSRRRLEEIELLPFRENLLLAPALMVGHLWVECLDEKPLPASLSFNVSSTLLKEELGYQRLVFSDDMLMKAITDNWGLPESCVMAVCAGIDQLLVCSGAQDLQEVHSAILAAAASGRISQERLQSALRARHAALNRIPDIESSSDSKRVSQLKKSVLAAEKFLLDSSTAAIKAVRGNPCQVFEGKAKVHVFVPEHERYSLDYCASIISAFPRLADRLVEHRYPLAPSDLDLRRFKKEEIENLIFVSFRALLNPGQLQLASMLAANSSSKLLVAADIPYDLEEVPEFEAAVAVYDPGDLAVKAFGKFLLDSLKESKQEHCCHHEHSHHEHERHEHGHHEHSRHEHSRHEHSHHEHLHHQAEKNSELELFSKSNRRVFDLNETAVAAGAAVPAAAKKERKAICHTEAGYYKSWVSINLRYSDTDRQGHINNAVYCTLFESGRVDFLFKNRDSLAGAGTAFVIARISLDYLKEMHFPGTVEVGSFVISVGRSSFTVGQAIFFEGKCCSTAESVIVLTDEASGAPCPISESFRTYLLGLS